MYAGGVAVASGTWPSDRHGGREQLSGATDVAAVRRIARTQRDRARAELDTEQRRSVEQDLGRAAAPVCGGEFLHRRTGPADRRDSVRSGNDRRDAHAETDTACGESPERVRHPYAAAGIDTREFPGGSEEVWRRADSYEGLHLRRAAGRL